MAQTARDDLGQSLDPLEAGLREEPDFARMIGSSPKMQAVRDLIRTALMHNLPVLIEGANGTGKELVARALHYRGHRSSGPFVVVNCAVGPETLIDGEMFGHERGAFTGAVERRKGKFEIAHNGTLFLDEIAEMPSATQAKLLRVLEGCTFNRLGGNDTVKVNVRVISATNKNLQREVAAGRFREDLLFRLQQCLIRLPALSQRRGDIDELVASFTERSAANMKRRVPRLTSEAMDALRNYAWPGNIRQLKAVIEGAVAASKDGLIRAEDLLLIEPGGFYGLDGLAAELGEVLERHLRRGESVSWKRVQSILVQAAVMSTGHNISEAAARIDLARKTVYAKLREAESPTSEPSAEA